MMKKKVFTLVLCLALVLCACDLDYLAEMSTLPDLSATQSCTSDPTGETTESQQPPPSKEISVPTKIPEDSSFEIHYLDVGQGDSTLVLCDGATLLIDGGDPEYSSLIYSYLQKHNISYIDYIVATHGHSDHVGGLSGALNYAKVGVALCSVTDYDSSAFRNFVKNLDKQGIDITVPNPGDTFSLGSAIVTVLGPIFHYDEPNNMSISLRIDYGDTSFLFTGDAEREEEAEILDAEYSVNCTVLHVGHHGSNTSTSYPFLRASAPQYAVISVGADNEYGHPTEDTLSKLRDADVAVYRTDMQGHIICSSDGTSVSFYPSRNANADTLAGAGAGSGHTTTETTSPSTTPTVNSVSYIVNMNTGKFHYPSCSSVDSMSEKNKLEVAATREELVNKGYSPCGRCKP